MLKWGGHSCLPPEWGGHSCLPFGRSPKSLVIDLPLRVNGRLKARPTQTMMAVKQAFGRLVPSRKRQMQNRDPMFYGVGVGTSASSVVDAAGPLLAADLGELGVLHRCGGEAGQALGPLDGLDGHPGPGLFFLPVDGGGRRHGGAGSRRSAASRRRGAGLAGTFPRRGGSTQRDAVLLPRDPGVNIRQVRMIRGGPGRCPPRPGPRRPGARRRVPPRRRARRRHVRPPPRPPRPRRSANAAAAAAS